MKTRVYLFAICGCLLAGASCKKDNTSKQIPSAPLENGVVSFSVNGQLVDANIDDVHGVITVTVPDTANQHKLTVTFTLASQVNATINGAAVTSGEVLDISSPLTLNLKASSGSTASYLLEAQNEVGYFGMPGTVTAQNSLKRDYNFYFDQFDGSQFQSINCGPTSTTMAIKWADSSFTGTPVEARGMYGAGGGWWSTGDIEDYLGHYGIESTIDTLSNLSSLVKTTIDNGDALILNPDMNYIPFNDNGAQHIMKFYPTTPAWGHFFLVKGYKQLGNTFFLEVYDPYSDHEVYSLIDVGELKGKDRYYNSDDVNLSTKNWWPYAIVIAPKGQKVIASNHLTLNSSGKVKSIPMGYGR